LGRSPFEVLYGYAPSHFGINLADEQPVTDIASWLHDRELMSEVIRQHLLRAKQRMKWYADGHRSERQSHVNDRVFLKLQPYVQSSVADRSSQKASLQIFWSISGT
jgi:hypothetical protein